MTEVMPCYKALAELFFRSLYSNRRIRLASATRPGRHSGFLRGHSLRRGELAGRETRQVVDALGEDSGQRCNRIRQCRQRRIGLGEVEGARHVAYGGAAPRRKIRHLGAKSRLNKTEQRRVVKQIGRDKPAAAKGRDHKRRYAETQANRPANRRIPRYRGVRDRRRRHVLAWRARRRGNRRNMIEEASIFVVGDKQGGLGPGYGIGGECRNNRG